MMSHLCMCADSVIHSRHVASANIFNLSSTRESNGEGKKNEIFFSSAARVVAGFRINVSGESGTKAQSNKKRETDAESERVGENSIVRLSDAQVAA